MGIIEIIIFIAVLVVLIVVHEMGHFFVAKWTGMRVDEFGLGYPPKLWGKKIGETEYTLNAFPFGGFVKIYGEDMEDVSAESEKARAFSNRPKWAQALVLVAGVAMNVLLAWILLTILFLIPTERALTQEEALTVPNATLSITSVTPNTPAEKAGLLTGDKVAFMYGAGGSLEYPTVDSFTEFVSKGGVITLVVERDGKAVSINATPEKNIITTDSERPALGVGISMVGVLPLSWWQAPVSALVATWNYLGQIAVGLVSFVFTLVTFSADLSSVAGPIGIAGIVGDASNAGIVPLMFLTALISLNLAVLNLLPFPALDGGRLVFVIIEAITRKRIPSKVAGILNTVGFLLLILLMIIVTVGDIGKLL